jgi:hypothetical protein
MEPALTLTEYATKRKQAAEGRAKAKKDDAATSRAEAAKAKDAFEKSSADVDGFVARLAATGRELPAAPARPDRDDLLDELDFLAIDLANARKKLVAADRDKRLDAARADAEAAALNAATVTLAAAEAQEKAAATQAEARQKVLGKLDDAPLKDFDEKARAVLNGDTLKAAEKRVSEDIPEPLRERAKRCRDAARAKRKKARDEADEARTKYVKALADGGGAEGVVAHWQAELERAEGDLRTYVATTEGRFEFAVAVIQRVADASIDPISDSERRRLFTQDNDLQQARARAVADEQAALSAPPKGNGAGGTAPPPAGGTDDAKGAEPKGAEPKGAEPKGAEKPPAAPARVTEAPRAEGRARAESPATTAWEKPWADLAAARKKRDDAVRAWKDARAKAVAAGKPKPDEEDAVKSARSDLDTALDGYRAALREYRKSGIGVLREWAAAVPPAAWQRFHALEDAKAVLKEIADQSTDKLKENVARADAELTKAIKARDERAENLAELAAKQAWAAAEAEVEASALATPTA